MKLLYHPPNKVEEIPTCDKGIDIVFVVDYTASMGPVINTVKNVISDIGNSLATITDNNYRIGLVIFDEYRADYYPIPIYTDQKPYASTPVGQKYINHYVDNNNSNNNRTQVIAALETMSRNNISTFGTKVNLLNNRSGGGMSIGLGAGGPEPSDMAINRVINYNIAGAFRETVTKIVLIITDQLPSGNDDIFNSTDTNYINTLIDDCNAKNINVLLMTNYRGTNPLVTLANSTALGFVVDGYSGGAIITALDQICED